MIGNRVSADISGYTVTCEGETATLSDGVVGVVGGHSFVLEYDGTAGLRTITFDGAPIAVTQEDGDWYVELDGDQRKFRFGQTVTIRGVAMGIGRTTMSIAFGADGVDANPAHIIYECLTNKDWGMGASDAIINVESFEDAGRTLFNEGFGLSMAWMKQSSIEAFIHEVIDHILATVFVNPNDGLITIKLVRDDYDPESLPELNVDNCTITKWDRKLWGETTNEIVVTWTNPLNEEEETVSVQDLANCAIQGDVISDSRHYYGVRNAALAQRLATRDLRTASAPLASFEIEVDRSAWNFVPGGCVRLVYPSEGIDGVIIRLGKIDYGKAGSPAIRVSAIEDIFGMPVARYTVPPTTEWLDTSEDPSPMDYVKVLTMPYYMFESSAETATYPEVRTLILATQPGSDTFDYDLYSDQLQPSGDTVPTNLGTRSIVGRGTLAHVLPAEAESSLTDLTGYMGPVSLEASTFLLIGDEEIAVITSVAGDVGTLKRGLLDTVPRAWPIGTPVYAFTSGMSITDTTARADGEDVEYRLLTRTSRGRLDYDDASPVTETLSARPWLPNRPANVKVGAVGFGSVDIASALTVAVTWANRNRLMEPVDMLRWDAGDVTPEAGQTTTVTVMKTDRTVLAVHDGLTGTSYTLAAGDFDGEASGIVRVTAKRDGFESLQGHELAVTLTPVDGRRLSGDEAGNILLPSGDAQSGTDIRLWS